MFGDFLQGTTYSEAGKITFIRLKNKNPKYAGLNFFVTNQQYGNCPGGLIRAKSKINRYFFWYSLLNGGPISEISATFVYKNLHSCCRFIKRIVVQKIKNY